MSATEELTPIAVIDKVEAGLGNLESSYTEVPDCTTEDGYTEAKELLKPIVKTRTTLDKARLAATKGLRDEVDRINSMCKDDILPRISAKEQPLQDAIKAVDDERKRIEQEAAEKESARIEVHENNIRGIKNAPDICISLEESELALIELQKAGELDFEEFKEVADKAIAVSTEAVTRKIEIFKEQAAEAAKLEAMRKEREAEEAKLQAERDKLEEARRQAIADAERKAAAKAAREKEEAAERAERERIAAVEKAKREEAYRIEQIQKEKEAKAAAEEAERERLLAMAPDAEQLAAWYSEIPPLPEMDTTEGKALSHKITNSLQVVVGDIELLKQQVKAA